ncbi:aldo/keto reductase [Candidatus Falkowbacteria bacterium]|nr:aldo/keto reductase [Candidatus Falkowbacteria bacterium]
MADLISKLVLGTAQFGLNYGINNSSGKPAREKSFEILDFAYEKGLRIFDTAYVYGEAEEILGEFKQSRGLNEEIKIITKLKSNIIAEDGVAAYEVIAASLKESLLRLKSDYVDGCLFHEPAYVRNKKLVDCLVKLKEQGLAKNIGVSIYEAADALYAVNLSEVDYIQIPYNIFDQRLDKTEFFALAKKNNIKVFARSPFLQGLFFMSEEKIPPPLKKIKVYLKELDEIINKYNLSRQQAALLFSLSHENIDYVVFGVDNIGQLEEYISIAKQEIDFKPCFEELRGRFNNIEKNIISPNLWKI